MQTMLVCSEAHWKFRTPRSSTLHKGNEGRSLIYDRNGPTGLTVPHSHRTESLTNPTNKSRTLPCSKKSHLTHKERKAFFTNPSNSTAASNYWSLTFIQYWPK